MTESKLNLNFTINLRSHISVHGTVFWLIFGLLELCLVTRYLELNRRVKLDFRLNFIFLGQVLTDLEQTNPSNSMNRFK